MATGVSDDNQSSTQIQPKITPERFTFFYSKDSPFSQFHSCTFRGISLYSESPVEYTFNCAEQWMMMNKADLFKDYEISEKIRNCGYRPLQMKALGRKVKNFDEKIWKENNRQIIFEGNKLKFSQNPHLMEQLKGTDGTTLVEASPSDRIYGIGLRATDPRAFSRKTWKGMNLLGAVLTRLRDEFMLSDDTEFDQF